MSEMFLKELWIFSYSCLLGLGLGILYDVFRIIRMLINKRNITIFLQDIIYFIVSGFVTFIFVLGINEGQSRFYILAGEGIGWIAYHITLGEKIYHCSENIVKMIRTKFRNFSNNIYRYIKKIFNKNKPDNQ